MEGEKIEKLRALLAQVTRCETCQHLRSDHAMDLVGETFCEHDGPDECKCEAYVGVMPPSYRELIDALAQLLSELDAHNGSNALINQWRRMAGSLGSPDDYTQGLRTAYRICASDLAELDAPAAPASSGDATKAWESTKASEYLCPRCWKLVPENAPCPYCAAPVLDHTECERSKEFLSSCIRSRDERIRQLLAAAPVTGAQGDETPAGNADFYKWLQESKWWDRLLSTDSIRFARDAWDAAALRAAPAERGLRDNEGTLISEYFRAIVHNIEHLNTETALNTARAGVKALAASEEREPG